MSNETTYISCTHEELSRFGEGCAKRGADQAIKEMQAQMQDMMASLRLLKGIVSRADLALMYGKDTKTIRRWAQRHNFKNVDGPDRRKVYYDIEDVKEKVRDAPFELE